jgi:polyhydroxyalkanoate synthesis repressor PhaR
MEMTILIKRYANRKLYNTDASRYITLKGISELIHDGTEIEVIDNETGQDITSIVLSQILVDDQKQHRDQSGAVPGHLLSELIQKGGDALYGALRRSVDDAQGNLADIRENVRRWIQPPRGREVDGSEISRAVHQAVERVFRLIDLPTRSDLEALNKNLERLAGALHRFEERLAALEAREAGQSTSTD